MAEPRGILADIAKAKRAEVRSRFEGIALDALRLSAQPTTRRLSTVIAKPGARFILEIKKASLSQGPIRTNADPAGLARGYDGVADALSVLCDGAFFGGSLADLTAARTAFAGPVLAKDFFVDPRQVVEARIAGADAVLVMLSLVDDILARALLDEAQRFGMDALVEIHDETEMQRAQALGAKLVGINNRDFRDLSVDLATTKRLAPLAGDRLVIAESGIATGSDVERLAPSVDGFLIGTSLMRAADPARAARALIFGATKICGLRTKADLDASWQATYAGLIFVPGTARAVSRQVGSALAGRARTNGMLPVGIFRAASPSDVAKTARDLNLHAIQLHGGEDAAYVRALRSKMPNGCEIWTAVSVGRDQLTDRGGDRLLFDNDDGGSGKAFDWSAIGSHPALPRALLAGGIGPDNAIAARRLGSHAIDVGSSVESAPGIKCPAKIAALFETLRAQSRTEVRQCA